MTQRTGQWTRREAVIVGAAAVGMAQLGTQSADREEDTAWIDAHSHLWPAEADRFPLQAGLTTKDLDPPSFTDEQLMAVARPQGVGRVVLIQHSRYHLFDNSYLLDVVRRNPRRFRAVGMLDDRQPHCGAGMKRLLPLGVTGFRITPFIRQDRPADWLDTLGMHEMWQTGAQTRQAMCCLINPWDLAAVDAMCSRYADTPVVIDHFARVGADGQIHEAELSDLCRLARHKYTRIKISAFYALGAKKPPHDELVPMIRRLCETFGPQRLMWGSDCPYQIQGVNHYAASIRLIRDRLDRLSTDDRQCLLRKTAASVFFFA